MGKHTYIANIREAEEGGYIAYFPSLPGCHTQGNSIPEVIKMAKEVLMGYLRTLKAEGLPIPKEKKTIKRSAFYVPFEVKVA